MNTRRTSGTQAGIWRSGRTDPVLAGLLGAGIVALVVLIVVLLLQTRRDTGTNRSQPSAETPAVAPGQTAKQEGAPTPPGSQPPPETPAVAPGQTAKQEGAPTPPAPQPPPETPAVAPGQTVKREETPAPPPPPKTVGKPDRLREILQEGKTYEMVATVDLANAVREREWGIDKIVNLAYRAETRMHRHIEKNDGKRIVEVRTFVDCRAVKITSTVEISFKNLAPGVMSLINLLGRDPVVGIAVSVGLEAIRGLLTYGTQQELNARNTKARAIIDSLTGKKVRIVYEDGKGVVELTPIDCSLTKEQRDFLLAAAVVTDAYWLPDVESRPGQTWNVPGEALSDLVPPIVAGEARGKPDDPQGTGL